MSVFSQNKAETFVNPTQVPDTQETRDEWHDANRAWWEAHPMRYDWLRGELDSIPFPEFSKEFYREIDRRFFSNANEYLPQIKIPFDRLIDYHNLSNKSVLEIGVGNGSHAELLASQAGQFTGIDLTEYGVKSTSQRMRLFGHDNATILKMNAEELQFADNSFDFVWSWGVIHHSASPKAILGEIRRVLKPGGVFQAMVYYRSFWSYYTFGVLAGLGKGYFFKGNTLHEAVQKITDGAIARYYTPGEWRNGLAAAGLEIEDIRILGMKSAILPIPGSRFKHKLLNLIPSGLSRILTNDLRMGSFLVSAARKSV